MVAAAASTPKELDVTAVAPPSTGRICLLYTSDAADERSSVELGGRRIIKKKNTNETHKEHTHQHEKSQHDKYKIQSNDDSK